MPKLVHFEIPAQDVERARRFYGRLFGWKFEELPGMQYWTIETGEEGAVGGGLMKRMDPHQGITNYMDVASVEEYSKTVLSLGGKVVLQRTAVPGMGWFAVCLDTEGNAFGLWEPDDKAK